MIRCACRASVVALFAITIAYLASARHEYDHWRHVIEVETRKTQALERTAEAGRSKLEHWDAVGRFDEARRPGLVEPAQAISE